ALRNRRGGVLIRRLRRGALDLLSRRTPLKIAAGLLGLLPRRGLPAPGGTRMRRLAGLLPEVSRPPRWRAFYPTPGESRGQVGLFTGCISSIAGQGALSAAIRVLNRLGRDVIVPADQACCGALHLHGGEPHAARALAGQNRKAFGHRPVEAIVSIASGCGGHLREHAGLSAPVLDISAYLGELAWPEEVGLKPLPRRVAVHDPCSLRNLLGTADAVYRLLGEIPGIELIPLPGNSLCCGAGGTNLLTQPQMADALLAPKLDSLRECRPDIVLTSNTGCALHFAAGIRNAGLDIEVLHPVQLLERQIEI
ncbi:MAG TPA: (Fe-S)-binding protein, partial [Sedimenticola sp.]|nr:(Fe-S)-binding protein [Sedimenticola sp.]